MLGLFEEQQGSPGEGTNEQEQSMVGIEDREIGGNKVRQVTVRTCGPYSNETGIHWRDEEKHGMI